ncbi:MAG: GYD domain-containing protein [Desulfobacteraceae bacterium]|nr:GYD domain-containing protein [Desulfobacteraceae bacterium]
MATYMMTFSFTQQGMQKIKESPGRVEAAKKTIQSLGGTVREFYGVLGAEYDTVFILEAPDDEAAARMAVAIGSMGNVRTSTHRLFPDEEYRRIISGLP